MQTQSVSFELNQQQVTIETGKLARQANGAVTVSCGETIVLVTACIAPNHGGSDFFPLNVDYREKMYSIGTIPGGYLKREGRPSDKETLTMRFIDRPIRPCFPEGYYDEVQIMASVLSFDQIHTPDILAMIGASAALTLSGAPFNGPLGMLRVGQSEQGWIANPTVDQIETSPLDLVLAGNSQSINMVEGSGKEIPEEDLLNALAFGHQQIQVIIQAQEELKQKYLNSGEYQEIDFKTQETEYPQEITTEITQVWTNHLQSLHQTKPSKAERSNFLKSAKETLTALLIDKYCQEDISEETILEAIKAITSKVEKEVTRQLILETKQRTDGRSYTDIRPISCEVGLLPQCHGSALFTRGETQALVTVTLGSSDDEQIIDGLEGVYKKNFMLHYNFPPFSVGEVKPIRSISRREIGHGFLAEKSLEEIRPSKEDFPYSIRIVSDILESNGSSSMASVCGGSLALFDVGAPLKSSVSGIAMGLILEGDKYAILSDILGLEDHLGDMDFKVAGTENGITGFQMDVKISGISFDILKEALYQAKEGRQHIRKIMESTLSSPRTQLADSVPKIRRISIPQDKIKDVIGSGGRVIKGIIERTGIKIDVDDAGNIELMSQDQNTIDKTQEIIETIVYGPKIGKVYEGEVKSIKEFGAFVEISFGVEGLVHISEICSKRIHRVEDFLERGQIVNVIVLSTDHMGRHKLSIKQVPKDY